MKRTKQKEQRRMEILITALDLFAQKGYAGTKTGEIAKAVGMSEGLLFHYFPTKEILYLELAKIGVQGTQVFEQPITDPYLALYEPLCALLAQADADRSMAKMFLLMNEAQNKDRSPEAVYKVATQVNIIAETVPVITMGQEQGIFRDGDPVTLAYAFWNALDGNMQELARKPEMKVPDPKWLMAILMK
ncbi:MAG: TetR/AcrR family transcriptional regulator [Angelakisella sp.]